MEEKHEFDSEFKLKHMGYGEWVEEPDTVIFHYHGVKCMVHRIVKREPYARVEAYFGGHLCGYIFLPNSHPFYGKRAYDIDLNCHGGVTFAEQDASGILIGFDCSHSGDYVPTSEKMKREFHFESPFDVPEELKKYSIFNPVYRNIRYCIRECKRMVREALHYEKAIK